MSRYRPIAPKPDTPNPNSAADGDQKSPYLRTVWAHLQSRPTRTRKRGRAAAFSPASVKRSRACLVHPLAYHNLAANLKFVPVGCCLDSAVTLLADSVELPLLRRKEKEIDLNLTAAAEEEERDIPVGPVVVSPKPIRPVGSSVVVESISGDPRRFAAAKGADAVEEMVEAERAPAIVSDSRDRVRMCNAAYRELVGQPECGWLDCTGGGGACRRIGGGIWLRFAGSEVEKCEHGFSGRVRIEWESGEGVKNKCVRAFCEGLKLECMAKDYQFMWRFYL
ncbi:2-oxoglutarate dehydrogenase E1 component [Striga asiatica]|uniref:2-oxoglutarate dehydrogenase E1 component n=1 Tax=Striga asiatica TaxID=4170 RepID=A0A5A7PEI5_STRAF|nr:2-oxoglutarate dehydrogenase E1 component [Striga asiatica]